MTCPTTGFMGHLSTWVSCTLAARFRTHHSQDVSLHLHAESSLDHDLQVSGSHYLPTVKKETFDLPPDHGHLKSSSLTDDSEDFHCEHFAVQIHLVIHHLSHTPNIERQSRVSGITFRTHMHGSHKVHGELFDRYETNDHTTQALFCVFLPTHFVSTSVATSVDDELLRTRLTCFSFPCQPLASL